MIVSPGTLETLETLNRLAGVFLLVWATWCIFSKHVDDGVFGKTIYSIVGLSAFAIAVANGDGKHVAMTTMLICMVALAARHFVLRMYWPSIHRRMFGRLYNNHRRESDGY